MLEKNDVERKSDQLLKNLFLIFFILVPVLIGLFSQYFSSDPNKNKQYKETTHTIRTIEYGGDGDVVDVKEEQVTGIEDQGVFFPRPDPQ